MPPPFFSPHRNSSAFALHIVRGAIGGIARRILSRMNTSDYKVVFQRAANAVFRGRPQLKSTVIFAVLLPNGHCVMCSRQRVPGSWCYKVSGGTATIWGQLIQRCRRRRYVRKAGSYLRTGRHLGLEQQMPQEFTRLVAYLNNLH